METLKQHRSRILTKHISLADVSMASIRVGYHKYMAKLTAENGIDNNDEYGGSTSVPEHEALWFYLRNHAMSVLSRHYDPAEPMAPGHSWLVTEYFREVNKSSMRMFFYLLLICARESRHAGSVDKFYNDANPKLSKWHAGIKGTNQHTVINSLMQNDQPFKLGEFTQFLVDAFYKGSYGGGYGGKKWGAIADVLNEYVHGRITAEMMIDTAFTLSHNNGPIFNKGMLYQMYNGSAVKEILDVQRAGLIPAYVRDCRGATATKLSQSYSGRSFVTQGMRDYVDMVAPLNAEFQGTVIWARVKELGAVGEYSGFIKQQTVVKPMTPMEKIKLQKAEAELAAKKAMQWQILPGVYAYKTKPVRAAAAVAA